MKNLIKLSLLALLLFPYNAYGGEPLKAGTILNEDSYVFSIEEAERLMNEIGKMERTIENQEQKIYLNEQLNKNLNQQILNLNDIVTIKDKQIKEYNSMQKLDEKRIKKLERRSDFATIKEMGLFVTGIGVAIGAILIADKIDDSVEGNLFQNSSDSQSKSKALIRF